MSPRESSITKKERKKKKINTQSKKIYLQCERKKENIYLDCDGVCK